jgi:hypothetical protein
MDSWIWRAIVNDELAPRCKGFESSWYSVFVGMVRNPSFLINAKSKSHSDSLLTFVMVTVYRRLCENRLSSR